MTDDKRFSESKNPLPHLPDYNKLKLFSQNMINILNDAGRADENIIKELDSLDFTKDNETFDAFADFDLMTEKERRDWGFIMAEKRADNFLRSLLVLGKYPELLEELKLKELYNDMIWQQYISATRDVATPLDLQEKLRDLGVEYVYVRGALQSAKSSGLPSLPDIFCYLGFLRRPSNTPSSVSSSSSSSSSASSSSLISPMENLSLAVLASTRGTFKQPSGEQKPAPVQLNTAEQQGQLQQQHHQDNSVSTPTRPTGKG